MKIAAFQAPLLDASLGDMLALLRKQVEWCETEGVEILCCPEAILGGLADYTADPNTIAIRLDELDATLAPIASNTVTTIVGFTEKADGGRIYNSAAIVQRGSVIGVYRKMHPAVRQSVYSAGSETSVFPVGGLHFGIVICNDSNYPELAKQLAAQGATVLFVPTNNGLPRSRGKHEQLADAARSIDIATAIENKLWVVRADVAGATDELQSYGSSEIIDPSGCVIQSARTMSEDLLITRISGIL